jgi:hypothetical protein
VAAIEGDRRPCSYFEDGASDEGLSSVVNVALSDATHGEHQVVPRASFESGEQLAYVEWVGNPSARETARAIRGTVEYLDGPSSESEWTEAAHAALRVAVVFEGDPVVEASCSGEQDLRTGEVTEHCDCRRLSGDEFQCSTTTDCCVDGTAEPSEVVDVQFEMRATPCAAACSFTDSSLAPYCRDLDG